MNLKYIIPIIFLVACSRSIKDNGTQPADLYSQPQKVKVNTTDGYVLNVVTGDSISPIILGNSDTLKTGVPIPARGKIIHPDSVSQPVTVKAPLLESLKKHNAHPNRHKIPNDLTVIRVKKDSIKTITVPIITKNDTSHYLVNSLGDTMPTGVSTPAREKIVKAIQPHPTKSLSPATKDAAICDLQYLDVDQGMNSSYVYCVYEDQSENLWFGTYGGGVSRYNGESFSHFTEKEGLSNNYVLSILEDNKGNFWFGTDGGGVNMYNGESFRHFTEKEGLSNNTVRSILEDKEGNLWFGTDGGGVSMYNGESFCHFTEKEGLSNNTVLSILEDKKGNLWFGTDGGGVSMYNGETFRHFTEKDGLSHNAIMSILEDKKGNLWFGTYLGGVSMYNGESFTHFTEEEGLSNNYVLSILEDKNGNLWFCTNGGGVSMYNGKSFRNFTEKEGLSNNYVISLLEDRKGNLWFGTYGGGVSIYNSESFTHFTEKEGLSNNYVMSTVEDKKGNLWFGTYGKGLSIYNGEYFRHFTQKEGLSINYVRSTLKDKKGNLWFGTDGGGVSMYDGESFTHFTEKEGLSNNYVMSILEDKNGNLWFGTDGGGASMYDGESFSHFTEKEGLSNNYVRSILEDKKGNLWFGTDGGGASMYNGESFIHYTEREGLSNNSVMSILEDKKGNLWFGTDGGGVSMFNGESFRHFTEKEGLLNNIVYSILEVENQELGEGIFFATEKGLNFIVQKKITGKSEKVRYNLNHFGKSDGLKSLDFFTNSVFIDSENRAWWGGGKGLEMLDLNSFKLSDKVPQPVLKQIDINEQFIDFRNISDSLGNTIVFNGIQKFQNYPLELELPYDKNHLTFHFAAIDWAAPHKIQYSYLIEGLNTNWSQPTKEPKAQYRNLPYGTYTLKIKGLGESGEWSAPFEYTFTIQPPWWHTWWARTLYVLFIFILILSLFRWRTAKLKQRQQELEVEVDTATKEIREQKDEIEVAHKEITDSISYAKRIQSAILPSPKMVKEYLPESFILYKPKDVVAGDFYWMEHKNGKVLFAAADCTGHGVPGAMVSVVCNNGLNRSVREYGLIEPGEILDKTREIIIQEFEKSEEEVKDGMDIALCCLEGKTLKYAGANNPLWIIRNGEVLETKADKQPIGEFDKQLPYATHTFELEKGDTIYLFSDGFADQFGGDKGKKFKSKILRKLLLSMQDKPMETQRQLLDDAFESWKGELDQVDDVCFIGVRI